MHSPQGDYIRPLWISKSEDGYLLHAYRRLHQVFPKDRKDGALQPKKCVGTWHALKPDVGQPLFDLDKSIEGLFFKVKGGTASMEDRAAAAYLRQLVDNFLFDLYVPNHPSNVKEPLPLERIRHEPMLNALRNLRKGTPWKTGAVGGDGNAELGGDEEGDSSSDEEALSKDDPAYRPHMAKQRLDKRRVAPQTERIQPPAAPPPVQVVPPAFEHPPSPLPRPAPPPAPAPVPIPATVQQDGQDSESEPEIVFVKTAKRAKMGSGESRAAVGKAESPGPSGMFI